MTVQALKSDYVEFHTQLNRQKRQPWLKTRAWWPDYLYHFTDVNNVVSILNDGLLLSRDELERRALPWVDAASAEIIEQTDDDLTDYVRFYFRPLTPTAYRNEGFRPKPRQFQGANCPVPVYLLFDHRALITQKVTRFSNGSLARPNHSILKTASEFRELDFEKIYHNQWLSEEEKRDIINARHAEVIYPKSVELDHLRYICCRSQAEYETLRNLLSPLLWSKWSARVRARNPQTLFNLKWLYVQQATLTKRWIWFDFNTPTARDDYGPFKMRVDIYDSRTSNSFYYQCHYDNIVDDLPNRRLEFDLENTRLTDYCVSLTIDDKLAYAGRYTDDPAPF